MINSIVILIIMLLILPFFTGALLSERNEKGLVSLVYGYLLQWSVFFVIAVYAIRKGYDLTFITDTFFKVAVPLAVLGLVFFVTGIIKKEKTPFVKLSKNEIIYLACFLGILLFQLYKTVFYAYADGDDSFYIATAQDISQTLKLYVNNAYLGDHVYPNYRYALSPVPVWLAMLANTGNIQVTTLSFSVVPVVLILLTYIIYNEIGKALFDEDREKRYLFLLLISVFVMFANVSTSTAETFLLTRARQGKEGLANIVLPFFFLMLVKLVKKSLKEPERRLFNVRTYILIILAGISAALMSVFGNILALLILLFLFAYVVFKRRRLLEAVLAAFLATPNLIVLYLYFIFRSSV